MTTTRAAAATISFDQLGRILGSRNWKTGVEITKHKRTINRQKLKRNELGTQLADPNSLRAKVFARYRQLLSVRSSSSAFNPQGTQQVLDIDKRIFAVLRTSPDGLNQVLCLQNIIAGEVQIQNLQKKTVRDLLANRFEDSKITLTPYQTMWLEINRKLSGKC